MALESYRNVYNAIVFDRWLASGGRDEFDVHFNCSANKGHGRWSGTVWQRHVDASRSDTCGARRLLDLWTRAYRTAEKIAPFYNHKGVRTSFRKRTRLWVIFCFRLNNVLTLKLHGTYELSGCEWYCSRMRFLNYDKRETWTKIENNIICWTKVRRLCLIPISCCLSIYIFTLVVSKIIQFSNLSIIRHIINCFPLHLNKMSV